MKKCLAIAVLLLASSLAPRRPSTRFEYGGRTITIDPDRGTVQIPGVYDNTGKKAKRSRGEEGDLDRPGRKAPQQAKSAPQAAPEAATPAAPAPAEQAAAPARAAPPPLLQPLPPPLRAASRRPRRRPSRRPIRRASTARRSSSRSACAAGACSRCRASATAAATETGRRPGSFDTSACELAARRLADGGEGRQGADRTMRPQSLRLFRRQEVEPERRAGSDQHEARQGQMERPDFRSEFRQHLRFDDRAEGHRQPARSGLRLRRHVLRRPDLDPRQLTASHVEHCAVQRKPRRNAGLFARVMTVTVVRGAACEILIVSKPKGHVMITSSKSLISRFAVCRRTGLCHTVRSRDV